jgi:hypothetical protein
MKTILMMTWQSRVRNLSLIGLLCVFLPSCFASDQNLNEVGEDKFEALEVDEIPKILALRDTTYVPIYSDIYSESKDTRFNLTATLSLRNTSFKHSIYVSNVDYYNSAGEKTKSFLSKAILLKPMQSVEYVIEEDDTSGGTGANFIIIWGSESEKVEPIFEGIMISTHGQQGISFSTKGTSISNK